MDHYLSSNINHEGNDIQGANVEQWLELSQNPNETEGEGGQFQDMPTYI